MAEQDSSRTGQYPEHDKLAAVKDRSQVIGEFLEFGQGILCIWHDGDDEWGETGGFVPYPGGIEQALADYFGIDRQKIDDEKRAMLDALRAANP